MALVSEHRIQGFTQAKRMHVNNAVTNRDLCRAWMSFQHRTLRCIALMPSGWTCVWILNGRLASHRLGCRSSLHHCAYYSGDGALDCPKLLLRAFINGAQNVRTRMSHTQNAARTAVTGLQRRHCQSYSLLGWPRAAVDKTTC